MTAAQSVPSSAEVPCRVCGSTHLEPLVSSGDRFIEGELRFSVSWCGACQCGTTQIQPDGKYWEVAYPEAYFRRVLQVDSPTDRRHQLGYVEAAGPVTGSRVLELGCSAGDLLTLLRDRGATVVGVEPSDLSRRLAESRGLRVVSELADVEGFYDIIVLFDVLEHLDSPREVLSRLAGLLSPAGRIIIGVPNIACLEFRLLGKRWFALELPRHLTHFSPTAMQRLAETVGLTLRDVHLLRESYFAKSIVDPRLADRPLATMPRISRALASILRVCERALFGFGNRASFVAVMGRPD